MSDRSPRTALAHRPWPLPERAHALEMTWSELCFLHWPVAPAPLQRRLPPGLELDLFDGSAWLGVVPFRMSGVHLRGWPALPGARAFPELNLRTYVRHAERAGVWFFSLDAASWLAVRAARAWFHLPYEHARMSCTAQGEGIAYSSVRHGRERAAFAARYEPRGPVQESRPGSLEHFLTERYALFAHDPRRGRLLLGEVHHAPWPLQPAEVELEHSSLHRPHGLELGSDKPLAHFARRLDVLAWSPRPL